MRILHIFPDTNLFIQCRPLHELDWSKWAEFDEVHLLVCRPVQREIDNQKARGNDRVGTKARSTYKLFREIILSEQDYKLIQEAKPRIKLLLAVSYLPNPKLADNLDYNKVDDEIVGCVHTYREQNPGFDVQLLTHDSGPMTSAKMLSLPFTPIPDDWLLQPENSRAERENQQLKEELARLKKTEPHFTIYCLNEEKNETDSLVFEWPVYKPLAEEKISRYMDSLKARFPLATDFGPRESMERAASGMMDRFLGVKEVFTPASDEKITAYTETDYPAWVEQCEKILRHLHILKQEAHTEIFTFSALNEGTRPGKDALITISAKGNFKIRPPQVKDTDEDESRQDDSEEMQSLPLPPKPPEGTWATLKNFLHPHGLTRFSAGRSALAGSESLHHIPPLGHSNFRRDPNKFYYKSGRSVMPVASFSLECEQWRHGTDAEYFEGEFYLDQNTHEISGALECQIHAENLSAPAKKIVPVRGTARTASICKRANTLIEDLLNRADRLGFKSLQ